MIRFRAEGPEAGERVDAALARRAEITRTLAQRALRAGQVRVAGTRVRPSYRLVPGDVVEGRLESRRDLVPGPEDIPLVVRHADARVLVVSKPPGLVTHPARGHEAGTLVNALLGLGGPLSGRAGTRPGIVHRLDKDTSGLLLVARDDEAQSFLVEALRGRAVERRYLALVRGGLPVTTGSVEAPVGRHPRRRRLMAVVAGGRPAVTHYEVLATDERVSLLDVRLETGRTHQIRVHLSHLGHPVLGDRTYGGAGELAAGLGLNRLFLHAWRLSFPHPDDLRIVEVWDPLPPDLSAPLERAGLELSAAQGPGHGPRPHGAGTARP
jgi:23S rRNA pseudouridine1911/1915/1917 synthase